MILTYLWPWNKAKVIKLGTNCSTPSKVIIMQNLKDHLNNVRQRANVKVLVKSETTTIISLEYVQKWKYSGIFIIYLTT